MRKALYSIIVCVGFALIWPLSASGERIYDYYIGEDDHGYGDVIGDSAYFGINRAEVSHTGKCYRDGKRTGSAQKKGKYKTDNQ